VKANAAWWQYRRVAFPSWKKAMPFNRIAAMSCIAATFLPVAAAGGSDWIGVHAQSPVPMAETVTVPAGSFLHPRPGEFLRDGHPTAAPRIWIEVRHPLEIMKYQVSATEYGRFVDAGACEPAGTAAIPGRPVTGVSHIDAEAYAEWYSDVTGDAWRLPTDVEWAFAAGERFAGDIEAGPSDPQNPAARWLALYRTESGLDRKPDPEALIRGSFGTNFKGLADVAGNVWEWTSTCYVHITVSRDGTRAESAIENCGVHVVEGFHRTYMSNFVRDGKSGGCAVGTPPDNLGFRLVREQPRLSRSLLRLLGIS